jgi:hypothetical protein
MTDRVALAVHSAAERAAACRLLICGAPPEPDAVPPTWARGVFRSLQAPPLLPEPPPPLCPGQSAVTFVRGSTSATSDHLPQL